MTAAPNAATLYRWPEGREQVLARPIAYVGVREGWRVLARDGAERLHVLDVDAAGAAHLVAGPVTLAEAMDAADRVVAGVADHGSVTTLVQTLAVGMLAMAADREAEEGASCT